MGAEASADWEATASRPDVDTVVVSTSNQCLFPISLQALRSGKNVLVEKPAARTPGEAREMYHTALNHSRGPLALGVGFNHRYHPAVWQAHQLFREGAIGPLLYMRCRYGHGGRPGYDREWRADPNIAGGGELLDQGIHAIDLFRWFGGEFSQATGFLATSFWELGRFAPAKGESGALAGVQAE
jgi:predicted dehydrogenase